MLLAISPAAFAMSLTLTAVILAGIIFTMPSTIDWPACSISAGFIDINAGGGGKVNGGGVGGGRVWGGDVGGGGLWVVGGGGGSGVVGIWGGRGSWGRTVVGGGLVAAVVIGVCASGGSVRGWGVVEGAISFLVTLLVSSLVRDFGCFGATLFAGFSVSSSNSPPWRSRGKKQEVF